MANASSEALIEARRPHRAYVLRKLIERQTGTHPNKLIPITEIILNTEINVYTQTRTAAAYIQVRVISLPWRGESAF